MCENIVCTIHMTFGNYAVFSHVLYAEFVFEYRTSGWHQHTIVSYL